MDRARVFLIKRGLKKIDKSFEGKPELKERAIVRVRWDLYKNPTIESAMQLVFLTERSDDIEVMIQKANEVYEESLHYYNIEHDVKND